MLKEILNKIESELATITGLKVGRYKGEFENGAEWNPVFPIVLQRLHSYRPIQKNMQGKIMKDDTVVTIYIADKDINDSTGLDTVEAVINKLDGKSLTVMIGLTARTIKVSIDDQGALLFGYTKGVEVYTLQILIQ